MGLQVPMSACKYLIMTIKLQKLLLAIPCIIKKTKHIELDLHFLESIQQERNYLLSMAQLWSIGWHIN